MIFEDTPPGTIVWNAEFGFGVLKSKSLDYNEDKCMIVYFKDWGEILVPRRNLTEIEKEDGSQ